MTKSKNIKIIREIKPKIRVIEKEKEQVSEGVEEKQEEHLEELVMDAPSAREFPEFVVLGAKGVQEAEQRQEFTQTTKATTEEETKGTVRYQIQTNVSEEEIVRKYQTGVSARKQLMPSPAGEERMPGERFINRELESINTRDEDKRYEISLEPEKPVKKRRYPWEA